MQLDISAAPELALLARPAPAPAAARRGRPRVTVGDLAGCLSDLVTDPAGWWGQVRFDPRQPTRIPVPSAPGSTAWLLVLPPGWDGPDTAPDWQVACLVAGELSEVAGELTEHSARLTEHSAGLSERSAGLSERDAVVGERPFRHGRTRVRGEAAAAGTRLVNRGPGYAVSLHAAADLTTAAVNTTAVNATGRGTVPGVPARREAGVTAA